MKNKIILLLIFSLLLISACAQTTEPTVKKAPQEPAKISVVGETRKTKIIEAEEEIKEIGNVKEENETEKFSPEIKELLGIADKKVQSLRYSYKGPETKTYFYGFFVRGNKIKYVLSPPYKVIDVEEDAYDAIYINKKYKTALAYCDDQKCYRKGKKAVLDYDESYIQTPLDWLNKIESAEKTGEELIEQRNTWKLSANNFTIWIDTFFGVPLQVKFAGDIYKFQKMVFNDVKDEYVTPS